MFGKLLWDLSSALRSLRRSPLYALTAGVALAIGIGANSALFCVVNAVLLRPLPFPEPQQLVLVHEDVPVFSMKDAPLSTIEYSAFRDAAKSYQSLGAFETTTAELSTVSPAETLNAVKMTASMFDVLQTPPEAGRAFQANEDLEGGDAVLISDALWTRRFGRDPAIIGRKVVLDRNPRVVIGVMPPSFVFPLRGPADNNVPADVFLPMGFTAAEKTGRGPILQKSVIGRLKPGVTIEQANAEAGTLAAPAYELLKQRMAPRAPFTMNFGVRSLRSEVTGNASRILALLSIAVGVLLLIACANVANLTLTRAAERRRERAVRAAMGASRVDLIRLALSESIVLAAAGAAAGIGLAAVAVKFFSAYIPADLPRAGVIAIDGRVVAFTLVVGALTAMLSGAGAAFSPSGALQIGALKDGGRGGTAGRSRHRVLATLVSAQFALTVILLIGGSLALRSLLHAISSDAGFRKDQVFVMTTHLPPAFYSKGPQIRAIYLKVAADAERVPGVVAAGVGSEAPLGAWEKGTIIGENSESSTDSSGPIASQIWITGHYLESLGVPLRSGRMFTDVEYRENRGVVMINDVLARKLWPGKSAVGRRLHNSRAEWATVVGVVGGVKEIALDREPPAQIYEPHSQLPDRLMEMPTIPFFKTMNLVSRSASGPATQLRQLTGVLQKADASLAISEAASLGEIVDQSSRAQKLNAFLIACFAGIALVLAVLGVASVLSYSVAQRMHEIGIRMALGATPSNVAGMVLGRGLALSAAGIAIGLCACFALAQFVSAFLYGVSPYDPLTFVAMPVALAAVALAAAWIPARRAARVDPMNSLRAGE